MINFFLIFLYLSIGVLLRRFGQIPASMATKLNLIVVYVSLPALILVQIPALLQSTPLGIALMIPISMAWILIVLSFVTFSFFGRRFGWSKRQTGTLILTSGLANTSFVGIPLLEAMVGESAIPTAILIDQAGSFLVLSTLGFSVAAFFSGGHVSIGTIAKRIVLFPPFIALMAAALWAQVGVHGPGRVLSALKFLAATLVPLALISVGLQLQVSRAVLKRRWVHLAAGLTFKLVLAPLFFAILYIGIFSSYDFATHVTILQAAMAPMITAAIVATRFGLDDELASLMLGIGIPLSMATVPLWHVCLTHFS